jgi:hypothetical protein
MPWNPLSGQRTSALCALNAHNFHIVESSSDDTAGVYLNALNPLSGQRSSALCAPNAHNFHIVESSSDDTARV